MAISTRVRRRLRVIGSAVVLFLSFLTAACVFFRISRPRDVIAYIGMAQESHPIWKKLALRQINAGDSAVDFVATNPPTSRTDFGRYAVYRFVDGGEKPGFISLSGLSVIARDGKLIQASAGSCCWDFTFFDDGDPDFNARYTAYVDEQIVQREKKAATASDSK